MEKDETVEEMVLKQSNFGDFSNGSTFEAEGEGE